MNSMTLYPRDRHPALWRSCNDAYDYTWESDLNMDLEGLSVINKLKLRNSMGFCPHNRCQLFNLTNSDSSGECPEGLCYSKIENGNALYTFHCLLTQYICI
jgi:hypothetical protein